MMTVKELKKILEQISSDKEDYIVTSECGLKGFDGEIFIDNDKEKVIIE
jgi:hypothetical protein